MDTPTKRRSLPPLGLNTENDAPSPSRRRGKSKKRPEVDASDSQQSGANRNATTVSEEQGNQSADVTDGRKRTRKKRRPTSGFDPDSGEGENMDDDAPINSSRTSNGAPRRKKESSSRMARIQRSVSDDGLASTDIQKSSVKKRHRPRSKLIESGDEDGLTPGKPPVGRGGKTKRKKAPKLPGSGEDEYLADGEAMSTIEFLVSAEDIVTEDRTADTNQPITVTTLPSQPIPRLFMERKDGFKSEDKAKMAKRRQKEEMPQPITSKTTTEVAIAAHKMSLTLSLYCHGLLAGFALWQCIVVYSLSQNIESLPFDGNTSFLIHYSSLAQPTLTIYYLLLALCTVSIFDRFDIARPDKKLFRALLTFKSGALAILLYFLALVFSVGLAAVDDRISLFTVSGEDVDFCDDDPQGHKDDLWPTDEIESRLSAWRGVNLVRALLSMFGWLLLALSPMTDFTTEHLYDCEEPLWEEQQQTELHQVQSNP